MQITLAELIGKIRLAQAHMGRQNAHRVLFGQCEEVLVQLVEKLAAMETQAAAESKSRILLP